MTTSYLVGIPHNVDESCIRNPFLERVIRKSSALYTEAGTNVFITSVHGSVLQEPHRYQRVPFRYEPDVALTLLAWCHKIPIYSLDAGLPIDKKRIYERLKRNSLGTEEAERAILCKSAALTQDPHFLQRFEVWREGDIQGMCRIREQLIQQAKPDALNYWIHDRERQWLEMLVPPLQTKEPICIVVGYGHVVGKGSLSECLRQKGLRVEAVSAVPAEWSSHL